MCFIVAPSYYAALSLKIYFDRKGITREWMEYIKSLYCPTCVYCQIIPHLIVVISKVGDLVWEAVVAHGLILRRDGSGEPATPCGILFRILKQEPLPIQRIIFGRKMK